MRRLSIALVVLAAFASTAVGQSSSRHRAVQPPSIPAEYRDLYAQLTSQLAAAEAQVAPMHPELQPPPLYATELLPANGNRGADLLRSGTIDGVRLYLDRLQLLGVQGVVFAVPYPLLLDRYPNSAQYVDFYRQVMAELRKRGMTVDIESSVVFANSPFSSIAWDYSKTTFAQFVQDRHSMAATIVSQLAPDYLDLGGEPDTEAKLTGFTQLNTPAVWAQTTAQIIQGIDRGSTKIGVGIGTWSNVAFVDAESALPIDFIALHIYPIDATSISTAFQAASIARGRGKSVILDEAWLFKARPGESGNIAADATVFGRDAFSFFAPLDQRFLRWIDDFARAEHVAFVSPFWSTYFFAYIPYADAASSLPYSDIVQQVNAAASQNILRGVFSATGKSYGGLIANAQ
jgi:hypothetical protein